MPIPDDGEHGETGRRKEWVVCISNPKLPHVLSSGCDRLQAIQKMQAAAGGKGRGANGMPTPAQIQAMQVGIQRLTILDISIILASDRCLPGCCSRCSDR